MPDMHIMQKPFTKILFDSFQPPNGYEKYLKDAGVPEQPWLSIIGIEKDGIRHELELCEDGFRDESEMGPTQRMITTKLAEMAGVDLWAGLK